MGQKNTQKTQEKPILELRNLLATLPQNQENIELINRLETIRNFILNHQIRGALNASTEVVKTLLEDPSKPVSYIRYGNDLNLTQDNLYKAIERYEKHFIRAVGANFISSLQEANQRWNAGENNAFKRADKTIALLPKLMKPNTEDYASENMRQLFYNQKIDASLQLEDCLPELLFFAQYSQLLMKEVGAELDENKLAWVYRLLRGTTVAPKYTTNNDSLVFNDQDIARARRVVANYASNNADKIVSDLKGE